MIFSTLFTELVMITGLLGFVGIIFGIINLSTRIKSDLVATVFLVIGLLLTYELAISLLRWTGVAT